MLAYNFVTNIILWRPQYEGKCQPKMIGPCDRTFGTKVIIVCDSSFRKLFSIVYCLLLLELSEAVNNYLLKPIYEQHKFKLMGQCIYFKKV